MPHYDIFTGGPSGSPIDWSTGAWSGANPPTAADSVLEQGAGTDDLAGLTIGGLVFHSDSSLTVGEFQTLTVTGLTDSTFGGAGSVITLADSDLTVDASVASATGTVDVTDGGLYTFGGSGATQTVDVSTTGDGSLFFNEGSHNNDLVTVGTNSDYFNIGADNGGKVILEGGLFLNLGVGSTATVDMAGGGTFSIVVPFSGSVHDFGANGLIGVEDATYSLADGVQIVGTPSAYSVDASAHTMTFEFTTSSGTDTQVLDFSGASHIASTYVTISGDGFNVMPKDVFTGATGGGSHFWSGVSNWSTGALPGTTAVVEQTGAGTLNLPSGGGTEQLSTLILENGAQLTIPTGVTLAAGQYELGLAFGGAGSTIDVDGALTIESGMAGAAGAVDLFGGTYNFDGLASTQSVDMAGGGVFDIEAAFGGTISQLNTAGQINVSDAGHTPGSYTINSNDTVTLNFTSGSTYTLSFDTTTNLAVAVSGNDFVITSSTPVCFASGTLIATTRGDIPVEDLTVGDLVVTASGQTRPIVWLGHRRIAAPAPEAWPVRVTAGAFGEGLPARDLRLSPGHAVCVDAMGEVLVPVHRLANGDTIFPEPAAEVTYWHVELASHDVVLAEGLPCESYMDAGNRAWFGREYGLLQTLDPERVAESLTRYARPFVDAGPIVEAVRERLAARAANLSHSQAA